MNAEPRHANDAGFEFPRRLIVAIRPLKSSAAPVRDVTMPTRPMRGRVRPIGMTFSVSTITSGTTGTPASSAIRASPVRPR